MIRKNKSIVALIALLLVAVLASGCFLFPTRYTVDVTVEPEGAAEVEGPKKVREGSSADYTFEIAEGYVYVDYAVDPEGVEVLVEENAFEIPEVNANIKLTLNFKKEDVEPPVDELEAAIEAAEEAIAGLEDPISLAGTSAVQDARALVNAAVELGADEDEIEGIEKLVAAEAALVALLSGETLTDEDMIKVLFGEDFFKVPYAEDELELPTKLTVGGADFVLLWTSESDLVEIEDGVATFTTPDEDATVILSAVLAVEIVDPQAAEPKAFDVEIVLEGKVSKLYGLVDEPVKFEAALEDLGVDFVKDNVDDYITAIKDILKPEKTVEELEAVIAAVDKANADVALKEVEAFNKAVETYFTTNSVEEKEDAYTFIKADILDKVDGDSIGIVDWLHEKEDKEFKEIYFGELEGRAFVSKEDLQAFVDQANLAYLEKLTIAAEADVLADAKLQGAKNFLEGLTETRLEEGVKDGYTARFAEVKRVSEIFNKAQDGEATEDFKTALQKKDKDGKPILENIVEELMNDYSKALAKIAEQVDDKDPVIPVDYDIQGVIDGVNQDELDAAIEWVLAGKADPKEGEKNLNDALKRLVAVTEKVIEISGDEDTLKAYEKAIADEKPATAEEIFTIVEYQNQLADVNGDDESTLNSIIQNDLEIEAYINLPSVQQDEVLIIVIANGLAKEGYESVDEFAEAVEEIVPDYLSVLAGVNEAKVPMEFINAVKEIADVGVKYGVYTEEQVAEYLDNQKIGAFFEEAINLGEDDDPRPFATIQAFFNVYKDAES